MPLILKIVLTAAVVFACGGMLAGNAVAAGRTAAELQVRRGLSADAANKRAMIQAIGSAIVLIGFAVVALIYIW